MTSLINSFSYKNPLKMNTPLTSLTIQLESGAYDVIEINIEDDPFELTDNFIRKHGINIKIRDLLCKNIKEAKEKALKELKTSNKGSKSFSEVYPNIFSEEIEDFKPKSKNLLSKIKRILNPSLNR